MGGKGTSSIRDVVPDAWLLLALMFATQTLALGALGLAWQNLLQDWPVWLLLVATVVFFCLAALAFAQRERFRRRGTAVTIVVREASRQWEGVLDAAGRYQQQERFLYWYPLVESRDLETRADATTINWSSAVEACRGMLHMVFDPKSGAPVDRRRIALMINTPLEIAFRLGSLWQEVETGGSPFELVSVRQPMGGPWAPFVAWESAKSATPIARAPDALQSAIAFVLMKAPFKAAPMADRFGNYTMIGEPNVDLGPESQPLIDRAIADLVAAVQAAPGPVHLVLATTSSVAFVAGYRLRPYLQKVRLMHLDPVRQSYVEVTFTDTPRST